MGDYRGRRRGGAASEPPQDGGYPRSEERQEYRDSGYYADESFSGSDYRDDYDGYQEPGGYPVAQPDSYGTDYAAEYATDYAEPRFDFQQRSAPETAAYEQSYAPPYAQEQYGQQQYEREQFAQEQYAQDQYGQPYAPAEYGYEAEYIPEYAPGYTPEDLGAYQPGYGEPSYAPEAYAPETYAPPQPERRRGSRRGRPADERVDAPGESGGYDGYDTDYDAHLDRGADRDADFDPDAPRSEDRRSGGRAGAAPNHVPFIAGVAVALVACAFVSPKAVAAVTVLLQVAAAFAVRDVLRLPGRRPAIVAAVPAAAATVGTFGFTSDVAATAVAAGIGAGFVLAAGDMVLRAGRRGVERGASRALAGNVTALLIACLTALLTAAARQSATAGAIGGVVYGILAMAAARNRELTASRAAVLGLPAAGAALAAYAAAILVA